MPLIGIAIPASFDIDITAKIGAAIARMIEAKHDVAEARQWFGDQRRVRPTLKVTQTTIEISKGHASSVPFRHVRRRLQQKTLNRSERRRTFIYAGLNHVIPAPNVVVLSFVHSRLPHRLTSLLHGRRRDLFRVDRLDPVARRQVRPGGRFDDVG